MSDVIIKSPMPISKFFSFRGGAGQDLKYIWDPYSADQSFLISLLMFVIGKSRTKNLLLKIATATGANVYDISLYRSKLDYHRANILCNSDVISLLKEYNESSDFCNSSIYSSFNFDNSSTRSLTIKDLGVKLLQVLDNIAVAKSEFPETKLVLILSKKRIPKFLIEKIKKKFQVDFIEEKSFNFSFIVVAIIAVLVFLIRNLKNVLDTRKIFGIDQSVKSSNYITAEAVDPKHLGLGMTEPFFFDGFETPLGRVSPYVRRNQEFLFGQGSDTSKDLVFISKSPVFFLDFLIAIRACFWASGAGFLGSLSLKEFLNALDLIQLFLDFSGHIKTSRCVAHVYNTLPNGSGSTRYDSGLITGVCRKNGVKSISYQSRIMYLRSIVYSFDSFDQFFIWGEVWQKEFISKNFIHKIDVIGHPEFVKNTKPTQRLEFNKKYDLKVVVFDSDIVFGEAQHYNTEYAQAFVRTFLIAIGRVLEETENFDNISVYFKTKKPENKVFYMNDFHICSLVKKFDKQINWVSKSEYFEMLDWADKVVAIGYTTPGMEALMKGVPTIFFSPYQNIYSSTITSCPDELTAHNVDDLVKFLDSPSPFYDKFSEHLAKGLIERVDF